MEAFTEGFSKILSLGIADIFDVSADAASNASSQPASPTIAAQRVSRGSPSKGATDALNKPTTATAAATTKPGAKGKKAGLGAVKLSQQPAVAQQAAPACDAHPSPTPTSSQQHVAPHQLATPPMQQQAVQQQQQQHDMRASAGGQGKAKGAGILDVVSSCSCQLHTSVAAVWPLLPRVPCHCITVRI